MSVIEICGLKKRFGKTVALDGVELSVPGGGIYGFIGPNGAGKSTTIRMLLGLLKKDEGDVRLLDGDPWRDAVELHKRLAYVPSDVQLWDNMTGGEVIDFLGRLRGSYTKKRR
ncbi:MAG: ATP-binding cassette domain-containing protein, partial [Dehalobacterium sp.]